MKKIFGTYRAERVSQIDMGGIRLDGVYTPSLFLNNQFADWNTAGLTNIVDNIIPEQNYIGQIVPGVAKLTRFIIGEYNEIYVDPVELSRSITNVGARFNIDMFVDNTQAIERIRANTNLQEVEIGKFLLAPATGELEAKYLIIE